MTLFHGHRPWVTEARSRTCRAGAAFLGERLAAGVIATYRQPSRKWTPRIGLNIVGDLGVRGQSLTIAERKLAQKAADVFVYLFAWETPVLGRRLRPANARDPFVFDTLEGAALTGDDPRACRSARQWHAPGSLCA